MIAFKINNNLVIQFFKLQAQKCLEILLISKVVFDKNNEIVLKIFYVYLCISYVKYKVCY